MIVKIYFINSKLTYLSWIIDRVISLQLSDDDEIKNLLDIFISYDEEVTAAYITKSGNYVEKFLRKIRNCKIHSSIPF